MKGTALIPRITDRKGMKQTPIDFHKFKVKVLWFLPFNRVMCQTIPKFI